MITAQKYRLIMVNLLLFVFWQALPLMASTPLATLEPNLPKAVLPSEKQEVKAQEDIPSAPALTIPAQPAPASIKKNTPRTLNTPAPQLTKPALHPSPPPAVAPSASLPNVPALKLPVKNQALLNELGQKLFIDIPSFTATEKADKNWQWSATIKNTGPQMISAGRLQIKVSQKLDTGTTIQAGPSLPATKSLVSKESINLNQDGWNKAPFAKELVLEVVDAKNNRVVVSKILPLPVRSLAPEQIASHPTADILNSTDPAAITADPHFDFSIVSVKYLGQANFQAVIRNEGNTRIAPNRLRIIGHYSINGANAAVVPSIITQGINPSQSVTVEVTGLGNEGECPGLSNIVVEVMDPDTGKQRLKELFVELVNTSTVTITESAFRQGYFQLTLESNAPYPVKVNTIVENIEIWDIAKQPKDDDGNILQQAWDFVTGGVEYDTSGLQPEEHKCTATNILPASLELAASDSPRVVPTWFMPVTDVQNAIRAKCPNVNFGQYSQIYKNLRIKASTSNISPCPTNAPLDTLVISEGGRDTTTFNW